VAVRTDWGEIIARADKAVGNNKDWREMMARIDKGGSKE
jgi:hypothetical protein